MQVISFKLDDAVAAELESRAAAAGLPSKHAYAKEMVLTVLTNAQEFRFLNAVESVDGKVSELKHLLATAVYVLLLSAGKVEDPAEAERWVRRNFFGKQLPGGNDDRDFQYN